MWWGGKEKLKRKVRHATGCGIQIDTNREGMGCRPARAGDFHGVILAMCSLLSRATTTASSYTSLAKCPSSGTQPVKLNFSKYLSSGTQPVTFNLDKGLSSGTQPVRINVEMPCWGAWKDVWFVNCMHWWTLAVCVWLLYNKQQITSVQWFKASGILDHEHTVDAIGECVDKQCHGSQQSLQSASVHSITHVPDLPHLL